MASKKSVSYSDRKDKGCIFVPLRICLSNTVRIMGVSPTKNARKSCKSELRPREF